MATKANEKRTRAKVLDGWGNILTGLGVKGRDKRMSATYNYRRKSQGELEVLYSGDDMAARLVDVLPEDMVREGFEVKHAEADEKMSDDVLKYLDKFDAERKIKLALQWARLYGGSGLVMGIDDGQEPIEPVNFENIKKLEYLTLLNAFELHPQDIQNDPTEPNFGLPETYSIHPTSGQVDNALAMIHASRVIRFDGVQLPRNQFIQNNYWNDSVLNRTENVLRNFHMGHDSMASLLADFSQAVFKIKNLSELIAQGQDDLVLKRFELVDACRSVVNAIVIQDDESFERKSTSLAGLPEAIKMLNSRLVTASDIPHTVLLGESPSGLGATGESENRDYYDFISRKQESELRPQLNQLLKVVFNAAEGPTKGAEPENWFVEFLPLWQMDQKELTEIAKLQAETDQIYIQNQVLDPDEVAMSRFGSGQFSQETKINTETRQSPDRPVSEIQSELESDIEETEGVMNGQSEQQRQAIVDIVEKVQAGSLPRSSALEILTSTFPMDMAKAESLLGPEGAV